MEALGNAFPPEADKTDVLSPHGRVPSAPQLETSLAERERQVLERELLAEQVTRLSKPLGEQVDLRQRDGLSLAKKVDRSDASSARNLEH